MPKVKELLKDAIRYDLYTLAYSVFIAVREGKLTMDDEQDVLFNTSLPHEKIHQELKKDSLCLIENSVKLFMIKYKNYYAMYLSKSKEDSVQLHYKLFNRIPERVVDATHKKGTFIYDPDANKTYNFYDLQKNLVSLPYYCGVMEIKK